MDENINDTMLSRPAGLHMPRQAAPIDRVTSPNALAKAAGVDVSAFTMPDLDDED
jgi:hypothetical protein